MSDPAVHAAAAAGMMGEHRTDHAGEIRGAHRTMSILSWLVLGLIAGVIAKILLPGRDPGGLVGTTLTGVAGAFVGGWLSAQVLDKPINKDFYDPEMWVASIAGALVLLIGYRLLFGHSRS